MSFSFRVLLTDKFFFVTQLIKGNHTSTRLCNEIHNLQYIEFTHRTKYRYTVIITLIVVFFGSPVLPFLCSPFRTMVYYYLVFVHYLSLSLRGELSTTKNINK